MVIIGPKVKAPNLNKHSFPEIRRQQFHSNQKKKKKQEDNSKMAESIFSLKTLCHAVAGSCVSFHTTETVISGESYMHDSHEFG